MASWCLEMRGHGASYTPNKLDVALTGHGQNLLGAAQDDKTGGKFHRCELVTILLCVTMTPKHGHQNRLKLDMTKYCLVPRKIRSSESKLEKTVQIHDSTQVDRIFFTKLGFAHTLSNAISRKSHAKMAFF